MMQPQFKDKFIAFVDVLGFKTLVQSAEAGTGVSLPQILKVLECFGSSQVRASFEASGPRICPQSRCVERNLDFRLTQVSDCAIISAEISPAGAINLVGHCWEIVLHLLMNGFMCRGFVTRGLIFHTEEHFVGTGYQKAYEHESKVTAFKRQADERGTPFVEIDQPVCDYVGRCSEPCVKEMFSRFVKEDGEVVAIFPFQRLAHSFAIGPAFGQAFDADKERRSNENLRRIIHRLKDGVMAFVDRSNPSALTKMEHYVAALDAQLAVCDRTDEFITALTQPSM